MNWKDWIVDQHVHNIPKEIVCFDEKTIYRSLSCAVKELKEALKKNWAPDWIPGWDLPYKFWVNVNIYTPFCEMKDNFKWQKKDK